MGKIEMIGKKFGKWVVIERQGSDKYRQAIYLCLCECGTARGVISVNLRNGQSKSCGCGRVGLKGSDNGHWKGGRYINDDGYIMVYFPKHPRAMSNGYIREHIIIAEKTLGKVLPNKAQVHHYGDVSDNSKIVICEDQKYHHLLHIKAKAFKECGDANKRKCKFCKEYDFKENLYIKQSKLGHGWNVYHRKCMAEYDKKKYIKRKSC